MESPNRFPKHILVYGTLRADGRHEMSGVLARASAFAGKGVVQARLFDLGGYPGITLSADPEDRVIGELYELYPETAADTLSVLDDYEGIGPNHPLPHTFRRTMVEVRLADGGLVPAWAYVLTASAPHYPRIASGDYLAGT